MSAELLEQAGALLLREAHCLDNRLWDEWLALYEEDAVFWMPAWRNEDEFVDDPDRELSLVYHDAREGLSERVWRLRSGQSPASLPLVRTVHMIGNVRLAAPFDGSLLRLDANFSTHQYDPKRKTQHVLFGFYEHDLRRSDEGWRIARKKISLLNDRIPSIVDFYAV